MPGTRKEKREVQRVGLAVQIIALLMVGGALFLNQQNDPDIPELFIWALVGLAYRARPETLRSIMGGGRK